MRHSLKNGRAKYGIVGSAVNVTQRIQVNAQGGEVVVSDTVYRLVSDHVTIKKFFQVELKGIQEPVFLHVVEGVRGEA
jgi:class 3 adenylate cyclase